jgi:hypothetical protein
MAYLTFSEKYFEICMDIKAIVMPDDTLTF